MTPEEYQAWVVKNWGRTPKRVRALPDLAIMALGLAGEAGEVCDIIKKHIRTGKPMDVHALTLELGDLLHYVTRVAAHFGISVDDLMHENVAKIKARVKRNGKNWKLEKST